jgi:hypothetical protein
VLSVLVFLPLAGGVLAALLPGGSDRDMGDSAPLGAYGASPRRLSLQN